MEKDMCSPRRKERTGVSLSNRVKPLTCKTCNTTRRSVQALQSWKRTNEGATRRVCLQPIKQRAEKTKERFLIDTKKENTRCEKAHWRHNVGRKVCPFGKGEFQLSREKNDERETQASC